VLCLAQAISPLNETGVEAGGIPVSIFGEEQTFLLPQSILELKSNLTTPQKPSSMTFQLSENLMTLVKLKDKGQVTIPASVREQVAARLGDVFEVSVANGNIVLKPQDVVARRKQRKARPVQNQRGTGVDIFRWIGAGQGLFKTPEDVAEYIRTERAQWD
jgi:AbrB family looped-hinge helix DNA binding protein